MPHDRPIDLDDDDLDRVTGGSGDAAGAGSPQPTPAEMMAIYGGSPSSTQILARLIVESNQQQRAQAVQDRAAARDVAAQQQMEAAGQLRDAAQSMMAGATTSMVMSTVMAGVSIAGSAGKGLGTGATPMNTAGLAPKGKLLG